MWPTERANDGVWVDVSGWKGSAFANARPSAIDKVGMPLAMASDEVLYRQGQSSNSLYYLDSGAVAISVERAGSEATIVDVHGPGAFFGARSLHEEVHNAMATTLLQSRVVRLSKRAVRGLMQTDPAFTQYFALHMMRRTARLEEDQIDRAVNPLRKRLARTLLLLASLDGGRDEPRVLDRMAPGSLARMLSADPHCIDKLLDEFREAGHIAKDQRLVVRSSLSKVLLPAL